MNVLVYRDKAVAAAAAATVVAAQIIEKPSSVLGFAYEEELFQPFRALVRMTTDGLIDWSETRACILSEMVRAEGERSIAKLMGGMLLDKVSQRRENRFVPDSEATDWSIACNDFENQILAAGGMDIALLAVRADGSVCYNVGAAELAPVTHVERMERGRVVTAGISTVMNAKKLVVMLTGADKADIASAVFSGPVVPSVPASYLQLHGNVTFLLDEDAAEKV